LAVPNGLSATIVSTITIDAALRDNAWATGLIVAIASAATGYEGAGEQLVGFCAIHMAQRHQHARPETAALP
jgi:hypothetical protein